MAEKKYEWGGTRLTLEELRAVDPMAASEIESETARPTESKSDRTASEIAILVLGVWIGGVIVALFLKG
ncbi:hypothetical protein [Rhodoferax sp.]|uniref:hypothetical protein n=1 Tax=Rhodoferax sp. TaxID=50421 RepID=UPI002756D176|nr:hypothetical protein [Rhodoferax sp.]